MLTKGISKGERGNLGPYFSLLTIMTSLVNNVFSIEELGILKMSKVRSFILMAIENMKTNKKALFVSFLSNGYFKTSISFKQKKRSSNKVNNSSNSHHKPSDKKDNIKKRTIKYLIFFTFIFWH